MKLSAFDTGEKWLRAGPAIPYTSMIDVRVLINADFDFHFDLDDDDDSCCWVKL